MKYLDHVINAIKSENEAAVDNDVFNINEAYKKEYYESGWDILEDRCITNAAKEKIRDIQQSKWHYEEYLFDII